MIGFLTANWVWLLLIVGMFAMHRMHGGCGGHQHRSDGDSARHNHQPPSAAPAPTHVADAPQRDRTPAHATASRHRGC